MTTQRLPLSLRSTLWQLVCFRPGEYLLTAVLATAVALLDLVPGPIVGGLFDTLSGHSHADLTPWTLIALLLACAAARTAVKTGEQMGISLHSFTLGSLLRRNLLHGILQQPGAAALHDAPGDVLSSFRDDAATIANFATFSSTIPSAILFVVVAFTVMLRINTTITFLVFLPLIVVVILVGRASTRIDIYRRQRRHADAQVASLVGEIFAAIQAVQVAGAEKHITGRLQRLNDERRRLALRDLVFSGLLDALSNNVWSVGTGLILLLVIGALRRNTFTVGDIALFAYYLGWVGDFTTFFAALLANYRRAGVALRRIQTLLSNDSTTSLVAAHALFLRGPVPDIIPPLSDETGPLNVLRTVGLSYHYPASERGIVGVDLTVRRGQFVVITGRVGSGKTTLLRVLLGLLPRDAGSIIWNDAPVVDAAEWFVPPRCAYVPQVPHLVSETLRDNILLGLSADSGTENSTLADALHIAVLEPDLATMADGLETAIGPRGVRLSGGQVQRVAAARMVVRRASLMVCDDLSSALDGETERLLWDRLIKNRECCYLVVSHRPAVLQRADHIIVLKNGMVTAAGRLDDLLESCAEMQWLWSGNSNAPIDNADQRKESL